jgi:two-component system, NarL family, response regulator LiaR
MSESDDIRVLIVDDNEVVRYSLDVFLSGLPPFQIVGQAANGKEAVEMCQHLKPDLILMDIKMPEMDGITATRLIHDLCPDTLVVILTSSLDANYFDEALQAGAKTYLDKYSPIDRMAATLYSLFFTSDNPMYQST